MKVTADRVEGTLAAMGTELAGDDRTHRDSSRGGRLRLRRDRPARRRRGRRGSRRGDGIDATRREGHRPRRPSDHNEPAPRCPRGSGERPSGHRRTRRSGGSGSIIDPAHPSFGGQDSSRSTPHISDDSLEEVQTLFELAEGPPTPGTTAAPVQRGERGRIRTGEPRPEEEIVLGLLGEPTISVGDGAAPDLARGRLSDRWDQEPGESSSSSSTWPPTTGPPPEANGSPTSLPTRR